MRLIAILAVLGFCVGAPSALAQVGAIDPLSIPSGAQARIIGPANARDYVKLTVVGVTPDTLHYRLNGEADSKALSWQNIRRMDVSGGRHSNFFRGLGIGLLVGVIGGAALGAATGHGTELNSAGFQAFVGGIYGGTLGALAGMVLGTAVRTESWIPVALSRSAQKNP